MSPGVGWLLLTGSGVGATNQPWWPLPQTLRPGLTLRTLVAVPVLATQSTSGESVSPGDHKKNLFYGFFSVGTAMDAFIKGATPPQRETAAFLAP